MKFSEIWGKFKSVVSTAAEYIKYAASTVAKYTIISLFTVFTGGIYLWASRRTVREGYKAIVYDGDGKLQVLGQGTHYLFDPRMRFHRQIAVNKRTIASTDEPIRTKSSEGFPLTVGVEVHYEITNANNVELHILKEDYGKELINLVKSHVSSVLENQNFNKATSTEVAAKLMSQTPSVANLKNMMENGGASGLQSPPTVPRSINRKSEQKDGDEKSVQTQTTPAPAQTTPALSNRFIINRDSSSSALSADEAIGEESEAKEEKSDSPSPSPADTKHTRKTTLIDAVEVINKVKNRLKEYFAHMGIHVLDIFINVDTDEATSEAITRSNIKKMDADADYYAIKRHGAGQAESIALVQGGMVKAATTVAKHITTPDLTQAYKTVVDYEKNRDLSFNNAGSSAAIIHNLSQPQQSSTAFRASEVTATAPAEVKVAFRPVQMPPVPNSPPPGAILSGNTSAFSYNTTSSSASQQTPAGPQPTATAPRVQI